MPRAADSLAIRLKGQVAVVTGGGSGIGQAACLVLAEAGARVAVIGHTLKDLEKTVATIRKAGGRAMALEVDISDAETLRECASAIQKKWGRVDVLVANAGVNGVWAPLDEIHDDEWRKVIDVNLTGTFLTVKTFLPMLKRRGGAVVIVASVNGTRMFSNSGASAYATTKAGQLAFARMLAPELAQHRIRVNTVCPGSVSTEIDDNTERRHLAKARMPVVFPKGHIPLTGDKPADPRQVGQVIGFLCSSLASHVSGAEIFVDGAESLLKG